MDAIEPFLRVHWSLEVSSIRISRLKDAVMSRADAQVARQYAMPILWIPFVAPLPYRSALSVLLYPFRIYAHPRTSGQRVLWPPRCSVLEAPVVLGENDDDKRYTNTVCPTIRPIRYVAMP